MYRVILAALAATAVAGCSLGTQSLPLNLTSTPATKIDPNFVSGSNLGDYAGASASGSGSTSTASARIPNQRTAMLNDQAPKKSTGTIGGESIYPVMIMYST